MKLGLINSAFDQVGIEFSEGIRHIAEIGFDTVDIHTEAWDISKEQKDTIIRVCADNGLPIISVPVCSLGIADFADPVRAFHVRRTKKFVDFARDIGARNVLLVLGEYLWQQEVIPPQAQWDWAVEGCKQIGDYAGENGLEIVLELEPFKLSIVNNVENMARFLDDVANPAVFANIDVSHVALAGDQPEKLRLLDGKAHHVHFSDCDGKVHGDFPPGDGVIDFRPFMKVLKEMDIDGALSIELEYCPQPEAIVEWVRKAYTETARLMDEVGLRS
ncbi:MAG: sugar phosphate isomerase/epimerase [Candidatus Glassbacteria bacterium]|nr:sugar phosphate isomerase/epimerase [Candidatus Glassbacteria bacterium]